MNNFTLNKPSIMTASLALSAFGLFVTWGIELLVTELFLLG
jgi:hypothetical protein